MFVPLLEGLREALFGDHFGFGAKTIPRLVDSTSPTSWQFGQSDVAEMERRGSTVDEVVNILHHLHLLSMIPPHRCLQEVLASCRRTQSEKSGNTLPVRLPEAPLGRGILKTALGIFAEAMSPIVKQRAETAFEAHWFTECQSAVGGSMKEFMRADTTWDTYMIGSVLMKYLHEKGFIPAELDDAGREILR